MVPSKMLRNETKSSVGSAEITTTEQLINRLMAKIASQAIELGELNSALEDSAEYVKQCNLRISDLEGSIYSKPGSARENISNNIGNRKYDKETTSLRRFEIEHREHVETLHRQLSHLEELLLESQNVKKLLKAEVDSKNLKCKQVEGQCNDLRKENRDLKAQLSSILTLSKTSKKGLNVVLSSTSKSQSLPKRSAQNDHMQAEKAWKTVAEQENLILSMKNREESQTIRIKVLEENLEVLNKIRGLNEAYEVGETDVHLKLVSLKQEAASLKNEISAALTYPEGDHSGSHNLLVNSKSLSAINLMPEIRQMNQRQVKMAEKAPSNDQSDFATVVLFQENVELQAQLQNLEKQRDKLMEYVYRDVENASCLNKGQSVTPSPQQANKETQFNNICSSQADISTLEKESTQYVMREAALTAELNQLRVELTKAQSEIKTLTLNLTQVESENKKTSISPSVHSINTQSSQTEYMDVCGKLKLTEASLSIWEQKCADAEGCLTMSQAEMQRAKKSL